MKHHVDSRFRGNDNKWSNLTFDESIEIGDKKNRAA